MKTKLGVSVGLLGAAIYLVALFGGYTPAIILAGYVLLLEENEWLKKTAVKALTLMVSISFLLTVIHLIPDLLSWIGSLVHVFDGSFDYGTINSLVNVFTKAIDIIRTVLFLALGVKALKESTVDVPYVDDIVNKYI